MSESADRHGEAIEETDVAEDARLQRSPAVDVADVEIPVDGLDLDAVGG
jgi:hypothetical protein